MYLITCGASWVNGDFSWVESNNTLTEKEINSIGPFLTSDYTDDTAYRIILKNKLRCDTYTNLSYGGSSNEHQVELLLELLNKHSNRQDIVILFGLKPFEHEQQSVEIHNLYPNNLFLFNTISYQYLENGLFNSKDLLSILSNDFRQVSKEGDEEWWRKIYKCHKLGLVDIHRQHLTKEGNVLVADLIFNEIKSRYV